jgi:L-lactate dehydrogenase
MTEHDEKRKQVAIIGCDNIEVFSAYMLAKSSCVDEVLLVGHGNTMLAEDLRMFLHGTSLKQTAKVSAVEIGDAARADVAVIASRVDREPDESWADHLRQTVAKVRADVRDIVDAGFGGVFLVTTNPIDVMAYVARHESGLPASRVIGLATEAENGQIGSATWCSGMCSSPAFLDNCDPLCPYFQTVARNVLDRRSLKTRTSSLATCVVSICEAILRGEKEVFPVSAMIMSEAGIPGVYLNMLCLLGDKGVKRVVKKPVTHAEKQRMQRRSAELRSVIGELHPTMDVSEPSVLQCPVLNAEVQQ